MVRQRDLFRKLLQDSAGDPAGAAAAAAAAGAITLRPEAVSTPPRVEVRGCLLRRLAKMHPIPHPARRVYSDAAIWQLPWVMGHRGACRCFCGGS